MNKQERKYRNVALEGGEGYNFSQIEREEKALSALNQRLEASDEAFLQAWTKELAIARRAEWNSLRVKGSEVKATEQRLGWTTSDLKRAIAIFKL